MTAGWCVRVSVFDDLVVSISERELAGRDLSEADKELIRDCARHLLAFVGEKGPRIMTNEPDPPPAAAPDAGAPQEHELLTMTEQAWLERYRAQFIRRGLDARLADDCAKAEPFAVLSEMFEDDPEGAADEELSYWEADDDV